MTEFFKRCISERIEELKNEVNTNTQMLKMEVDANTETNKLLENKLSDAKIDLEKAKNETLEIKK